MSGIFKQKKITAENVVITSFLVNFSDIFVNAAVAVLSGSVIVLSQSFKGIADQLATVFLLIGTHKAKKPSDNKHPFGHGRELYFWAFLSALVTFTVSSGLSLYYGYQRFIEPQAVENLPFAYGVLIFAIITNGYSMSLSLKRLLGPKPFLEIIHTFKYSALIETKTTLILDSMGTVASLSGLAALILYQLTGDTQFDGIGAMVIGIILGILALVIIKGAKDLLVGQAAAPEVQENILRVVKKDPNVRSVIDLRTLHIGPDSILVNIEIHLKDELTTDEIEVLIDKIQKEIKEEIPSAVHIQIELETPDVDKDFTSK